MRDLDDAEQKILKEIIRDPRISDNRISKITKIPVKTVNRKRKILEKEGILYYFASVNNLESGTGIFGASHLYIVHFKNGITKKQISDFLEKQEVTPHNLKHINTCLLGESNGNAVLVLQIESRREEDIVEIFNADITNELKKGFGDCVKKVDVVRINNTIKLHHNYLLTKNIVNGKIRDEWPSNLIFVR